MKNASEGYKNENIREMSGFKYQLCSVCNTWKKNEEFPFVPENVSSWLKADRICSDCQEKKDAEITKSLIEEKKKLKENKPDPVPPTKEKKESPLFFESDTLTPPKKQKAHPKKPVFHIYSQPTTFVLKKKIPETTEEILPPSEDTNTQEKGQEMKVEQSEESKSKPTVISKTCTQCGKSFSLEHFHKKSSGKDGYSPKCKYCVNAYLRSWNKKKKPSKKNREEQILKPTENTASVSSESKVCNKCKKTLPISSFRKTGHGRYRAQCKKCQSIQDRERYAKKKGLPKMKSNKVENKMPSSPLSTYIDPPPVEEKPLNSTAKEPLFSGNHESYQQYNEAKTIVFLLEFMISQVKITPEVLQILSFILQDLNASSNPYLKIYLTETINKVKQFQEIMK